MAHTLTFLARGAEVDFHGSVAGAEIIAVNEDIVAHTFEGPLRFVLVDFSATTACDITSRDVERNSEIDIAYAATHPAVDLAVAAPVDLLFNLSRLYQGLMHRTNIASIVVRTRREAVEWLRQRGHTEIVS
ncbi:MAG TPA: hypothetical protein VEQ65_08035 [Opitutus sp.]|nr:hypothetical protein [Opitutus sp.]